MKAVIMAGGEGTRLRPLTCNLPKPMVSVANRPVMEHIIKLLAKHNITQIAVTLQYMPDIIKEYFEDGQQLGVNINYYTEDVPLGTAGSVKNAEGFLDDTFIVISGDALTDINLNEAIDFHRKNGSVATLVLKKVGIPLEYGIVVTSSDGRIIRFLEKPGWGEVFSDAVNTGIYILSPEVLQLIPAGKAFDFSKDLFPLLLKQRAPMYGFVTQDYWCDIGDLKAYSEAHIDILEGRVRIDVAGNEVGSGIWVDEDTEIAENVLLRAPCIIGKNVKIKPGSVIGSHTLIGNGCSIGNRSKIERSVMWKNCMIGNDVFLEGSLICNKVKINDKSFACEHSVIGDKVTVSENVLIKPEVKIWPSKVLDQGLEVNANLILGTKFTRSIFGSRGVACRANIDATPEFGAKLGAAFAEVIGKKNKIIGVGSDGQGSANMLKASFIAGLMSAGATVYDLGSSLLPITRFAVRLFNMAGAIHITDYFGGELGSHIDFLNSDGSNIAKDAERKIEAALMREDFARCESDSIKEVKAVSGFNEFYLRNIINSIKSKNLKFKIALCTHSNLALSITQSLFSELGCTVEKVSLDALITSGLSHPAFDLGVYIDDASEKLMLIDDTGEVLTEDLFTAVASMILLKNTSNKTVFVPISASNVVDKLAFSNGANVVRTKTSQYDLMSNMLRSTGKKELSEQFEMYFDAISALVKILDYMSLNNTKLSEIVRSIPNFFMNRKEVACDWGAKGNVIRNIIEENPSDEIETLEGVKIQKGDGWVLVLPDSERPVCRIISEGTSAEFAQELADVYVEKVREITNNPHP